MAVPIEEVNDAITYKKVPLAKSTSLKPSKYRVDSVVIMFGHQRSTFKQIER